MGTAERWEFALLGPVEARRNGEPVSIPGRRPRALLALLLLRADEVVSRERLNATEIVAFGVLGLTRVAHALGDEERSAAQGAQALDLFARLSFRDRIATCCIYLAEVAGDGAVRGARLLGASSALRSGTGAAPDAYERDVLHGVTATLRERLGDAAFQQAYDAGAREADDVVAEARAPSA